MFRLPHLIRSCQSLPSLPLIQQNYPAIATKESNAGENPTGCKLRRTASRLNSSHLPIPCEVTLQKYSKNVQQQN